MFDYNSLKKRLKENFMLAALCVGLGGMIFAACMISVAEPANTTGEDLPLQGVKIVIDAGHGGKDGGAEGYKTSVKEAEINLDIALKLRKYLVSLGAEIIMTREDTEALGDTKKEDMRARREIIETAGQNFTISIHQNSFPDHSSCGPQVMYAPGSQEGEELAGCIQKSLVEELNPLKVRVVLPGDYFIVNSGSAPVVIVECGFLSNEQEEALLVQEEYREKIVTAVVHGICNYMASRN